MLAEASMGLSALQAAFNLAKGMKDLDTAVAVNSAVIELQENIISAQQSQTALIKHVDELEKEVAHLKAWETEEKEHELTAIADGVFAYAKKESMRGSETAHYLCANCFNDRHKSILQKEIAEVGRWPILACPRCHAEIYPEGGGREQNTRRR